jgi:hypothetical protein
METFNLKKIYRTVIRNSFISYIKIFAGSRNLQIDAMKGLLSKPLVTR